MKLGTLILAAAVLVLAAFLLRDDSLRISKLDPQRVNEIRVEKAGKSPVVFSRSGPEWRKTADLLFFLGAKASRRLSSDDPARYGLDKPAMILEYDRHKFVLGMLNPVTGEQYVGAEGGVFLISPRYTVPLMQEF